MSQSYTWPSSSAGTVSLSAIGNNGATAPITSLQVGGVSGAGNLTPLSVDSSGNANVNVVSISTPTDKSASGTLGALNAAVTIGVVGCSTARANLIGSSATMTTAFEATMDGTNWISVFGVNTSNGTTGQAISNPTSANYSFNVAGFTQFRIRVSSYSSGSAAIVLISSGALDPLQVWNPGSPGSLPVSAAQSGTWNISNISGTISLPTGAATSAKQPALGTAGSAATDVITVQGIASMTALKVDGSAVTQPVSAASLPLPSGAATSAKQPALGTAGTPSADVLTVQGAASMTALKVDGSAVTQPVSIAATLTVNSQAVPQSSATNANSSVASTALETSHVIKASAGRLFQLTGVNTKTSAQYIQVFNSATVPADTTVPVLLAYVPAGANFSFDFGSIGRYFSTGISVSNSSTAGTKTIGSADCWFNAEYL